MYIEINNIALKEDIVNSKLFKAFGNYDDLRIEDVNIKARYTSDNYCDVILFSTEYWLQEEKNRVKYKNEVSDFISILKNRKYHLDPECNDGLGLDITKNVSIIITVRPDIHESKEYFLFII